MGEDAGFHSPPSVDTALGLLYFLARTVLLTERRRMMDMYHVSARL